jgi:hypothetical protein
MVLRRSNPGCVERHVPPSRETCGYFKHYGLRNCGLQRGRKPCKSRSVGKNTAGFHGQHQWVLLLAETKSRASHVWGKKQLHCSPTFRLIHSPPNVVYERETHI